MFELLRGKPRLAAVGAAVIAMVAALVVSLSLTSGSAEADKSSTNQAFAKQFRSISDSGNETVDEAIAAEKKEAEAKVKAEAEKEAKARMKERAEAKKKADAKEKVAAEKKAAKRQAAEKKYAQRQAAQRQAAKRQAAKRQAAQQEPRTSKPKAAPQPKSMPKLPSNIGPDFDFYAWCKSHGGYILGNGNCGFLGG